MRYGRGVPSGFLPIYSVDTKEEAESLLTLACPRNATGEFVAPELVDEQTLDNLRLFGRRLARAHALMTAPPLADPPRVFTWRGRTRLWSEPGG